MVRSQQLVLLQAFFGRQDLHSARRPQRHRRTGMAGCEGEFIAVLLCRPTGCIQVVLPAGPSLSPWPLGI